MHNEEPSLASHLKYIRSKHIPEGGLSTVIYCGKVYSENDISDVLQVHREIVEEEVNKEQVNVTGILIGQVNHRVTNIFIMLFPLSCDLNLVGE